MSARPGQAHTQISSAQRRILSTNHLFLHVVLSVSIVELCSFDPSKLSTVVATAVMYTTIV